VRTVGKRTRVTKKEVRVTWKRVMGKWEKMKSMRRLAITRVSMMMMRKVGMTMTVTLIHTGVMTVTTKRRSPTRRRRARNKFFLLFLFI
jgi:hypothetical protein